MLLNCTYVFNEIITVRTHFTWSVVAQLPTFFKNHICSSLFYKIANVQCFEGSTTSDSLEDDGFDNFQ